MNYCVFVCVNKYGLYVQHNLVCIYIYIYTCICIYISLEVGSCVAVLHDLLLLIFPTWCIYNDHHDHPGYGGTQLEQYHWLFERVFSLFLKTSQRSDNQSHSLGIQSCSQMMIGVSNHFFSIIFRFHYHSQEVIGSLGIVHSFMYPHFLICVVMLSVAAYSRADDNCDMFFCTDILFSRDPTKHQATERPEETIDSLHCYYPI